MVTALIGVALFGVGWAFASPVWNATAEFVRHARLSMLLGRYGLKAQVHNDFGAIIGADMIRRELRDESELQALEAELRELGFRTARSYGLLNPPFAEMYLLRAY